MATSFYCVGHQASVYPTAGTKAGSLPKAANQNSANSSNEGVLSTIWNGPGNAENRTTTLVGTTQQSNYFGRFSSKPLAAQTIPAQTWTWQVFLGETNTAANMYLWPVMYVWRPSNNTVVGYIVNTSAQAGTEIAAAGSAVARSIAGSAVTCLDDDILVVECWTCGTPTSAGHVQTWRHTTNVSFISSPATIAFKPSTIFYYAKLLTAAVAPTTGTKASNLPKSLNTVSPEVINEFVLTTTTPSSPQGLGATSQATTSQQSIYFGRYSSAVLQAQTIPAMTWDWYISSGEGNANANMFHWPVLYVWRPSINSVVGYIFDANTDYGPEILVLADPQLANQFSGASVTCEAGDILVAELWIVGTQAVAAAYSQQWWSDAANAYISCPYAFRFNPPLETLTENFEAPLDTAKWTPGSINGTVTFTGGVGEFAVPTPGSGRQARIDSKNLYEFKDTRVFVKVVQPAQYASDAYQNEFTPLALESPGTNRLVWVILCGTAGILSVGKTTSGSFSELKRESAAYFAAADTYRWLSIRETAGTIYWESAPSTASDPPITSDWVVRHSVASSSVSLNLLATMFSAWLWTGNATATQTQIGKLDALNTSTGAAPARRRWFLTN